MSHAEHTVCVCVCMGGGTTGQCVCFFAVNECMCVCLTLGNMTVVDELPDISFTMHAYLRDCEQVT